MHTSNTLKYSAIALGLASMTALLLMPLIAGAQPQSSPPNANVNAKFNSVTIRNGGADNLSLASDGTISNAAGAVRVNDANGFFVNGTGGIGPVLTVTGNGANNAKMHSDGWITSTGGFHLGGDGTYGNSRFVIFSDGKITANNGPVTIWDADGLDVRGDITNGGGQLTLEDDTNGILLDSDTTVNYSLTANSSLTALGTVTGSKGDFTYHLKARRIGDFPLSKELYITMAPNAVTEFKADLNAGVLTCPKDAMAITCSFSAYNGTAGCGTGNPSGGLNKDAVYPTYTDHDPLFSDNKGGYCSMALYNKTAGWVCGKVTVVCWDTDDNL
jgi:hypothetical protein